MSISESLFPDAHSIRALCDRREPEALALEFKEKSDPSNPIPSKEDRRNIAKSVSAMANGSGGSLIYGIRTAKHEGADCASEVKPIADITAFESQFKSVVFSYVSPEFKTWETRVITDDDISGRGYLICDIKTSPDRPHMSIAASEHTYYRRSFQGDLPMTPMEVREQILAVKEGQLRLRINRGGGSSSLVSDWLSVKANFNFLLENSGQTMCKNPFLRVETDPPMACYGNQDPLTLRHRTEFAPGLLLHIGDVLPSLTLSVFARILKDRLRFAMQNGDKAVALDSIKIYDGDDDLHSRTIGDKTEIDGITLQFLFGAENAATKRGNLHFDANFLKTAVFHASFQYLVDHWGGRHALSWNKDRELEFFGLDNFGQVID